VKYYESHKIHIFDKINAIELTIFKKMLPLYDDIEAEAKEVAIAKIAELGASFNPDTMDASDVEEKAWEAGIEHYELQLAMKAEFLLSTATWLFHLFEKNCKKMCPYLYNKPEELKTKFEELGINCDNQSDWHKTNTELRLAANTIKHGEGHSSKKLQRIRPEYFDTKSSYLTDSKIEITRENIQSYIEHMKSFWCSFFDAVLQQPK